MLIDKDAKLFGKINIIDFFIILAIICAGVFLAFRLSKGSVSIAPSAEVKSFTMKFYVEEVENFRVEAMNVGDNLYDDSKNIHLGKVTNLDIKDAVVFNPDREGNTVKSNKEGYSSMEISTELQATPFENGVIINGNRYGIGHSLTIRAGKSFIYLRISGLEEKSGS